MSKRVDQGDVGDQNGLQIHVVDDLLEFRIVEPGEYLGEKDLSLGGAATNFADEEVGFSGNL